MKNNFVFSAIPKVNYRRNKFSLNYNNRLSMSVGSLYPIYIQEVYPGDTFRVKQRSVVRSSSAFLKPVMDNLFLDTYYFFVPLRLVNDKFVNVMGENTESKWAPEVYPSIAMLPSGTVASKTVGDYLGLPVGQNIPAGVSPLPFRAFALIYNEWFRDENNIDPVHINTTNVLTSNEIYNNNDWSSNNYFGKLPKVAKFHDYFTTALPNTQKSADPVTFSLGGLAPIGYGQQVDSKMPMRVSVGSSSLVDVTGGRELYDESTNDFMPLEANFSGLTGNVSLSLDNLYADLDSASGGLSVNDLRYAVQLQKMLEKLARGGSRYVEYLSSFFGVQAPDARLQRPEYLGGNRQPINIQQVPQTSAGTSDSPIATLGAYSLTNGMSRYTKSFVEHGYVIGVACMRQFHTYQQGIEKFWMRSEMTDFYNPLLSHLGEQVLWQTELYANGQSTLKSDVFGYQEAWADLRYRPSRCCGEMRSNVTNTFDIWHFADDYANAPVLGKEFIEETPQYVDRTLSVPSTSVDQFLVDMFFEQKAYRVLPTYSIPGYVDHDFV